jgi:hypothetical protein
VAKWHLIEFIPVLSFQSKKMENQLISDEIIMNKIHIGDSDEPDHLIPGQADHQFRGKLTRGFRYKLTTLNV